MKTFKNNTFFSWNYPVKCLLVLFITTFLIVSCNKDDEEDLPQPDTSAFTVINASPGQTSFNFALDNFIVNGPALVYTAQSGYLLAYSGTRKFDATLGGTAQSVLTESIILQKDTYYSVFITGSTSLSVLLTEDDLSTPATSKAKIRFIQLSPDAGTLSLNIKGGANLFPGQAFKVASAFTSIDPATHIFEIKDAEGIAIGEKSVTLTAGKIYTVWAGGLLEGTGNTAMAIYASANN